MAGVSINRKREESAPDVTLITPYGTQITVGAKRAETLLNRPPIRLGDGAMRKYVREGEDPLVKAETSGAQPPRKGARENTEV